MELKVNSSVMPLPPTGSLKERQRQERVDLILKTAEDVLAEKNYQEMSMDEIAARVGIAKGTIYLHFPSKEDLVAALFKRTLASTLEGVLYAAAQPLSAQDRLKLILSQSYGEKRKKQTQQFMSLIKGGSLRKEILEKQFSMREYFTQLSGAIKQIMEDGKENGEFDKTIPVTVMLTAFLPLLNRPGYEDLLGEELLSAEELTEQVARVYFHGISQK